jgi:hypothetical protein
MRSPKFEYVKDVKEPNLLFATEIFALLENPLAAEKYLK